MLRLSCDHRVMPRPRRRQRPLLIAAEGLDGAGKSAQLDLLARWLERRGRSVTVERWPPSELVERAAATPRLRPALTARVAALLSAAESARRLDVDVRRPLEAGSVVLADRYVWTGVAREIARGLDPDWVASLYAFAPRPDIVMLFRQPLDAALANALQRRDSAVRNAAMSAAFGAFLERMIEAFDELVAGAGGRPRFGPWPVPVLEIDPSDHPDDLARVIRAAVRPLLAEVAAA